MIHRDCKGTGWVKVRIPAERQNEYGGRSYGWAWCGYPTHEASDESFPQGREDEWVEPPPYEWEGREL